MQEFLSFLSSLNFTINAPILDGKIHRFDRNGKKGNGWYIGWQNFYIKSGEPYIVCKFGDWRAGDDHVYKPSGSKVSKDDLKAIKDQIEESAKRQAAEKELAQKESAIYTDKVWKSVASGVQGTSSYLERKKITAPKGIAINSDGVIFVPMYDTDAKLWGMQRIFAEKQENGSDKKFMFRQKTNGTFFTIGSLDEATEAYICEGFATGCTINQVTGVTTVCSFTAENLKHVAKEIHSKHPNIVITICADDDRFNETGNVGVTKGTQAAELCNGILKIPQFTKDDHRGTDFNDLFCFEGEAVCKAQFSIKEEPKSGFFPLGYVEHDYYFYSVAQKDVVCISTFSNTQLYALAPSSYWEGNYPNTKGGIAWEHARDFLVALGRAIGPYDSFRIRGTGVWSDRGRVVINTGSTLTVDGKQSSMLQIKSRYIYTRTKTPMCEVHPRPLTVEECGALIDVCNMLLWENSKSGPLLAGWLATARISGALPIRPHVWITGGAGVGKSTIMEQLVANALGDPSSKIYAQGGSTEAGIRQTMKGSAMPMIFDEFETTDEKSTSGRVATIIEMFRQAWSESQGVILKGSASGTSDMYSINFSALVASIRPSLVNDADKSRFSLLELTPHRSEPGQWVILLTALEKITPEFGERLFARMVGMVHVVTKSSKILSDALAITMGKRYGQQNGMLLAGFWALCSDTAIDAETARNLVGELEIQYERDEMVPDHIACATHLLTSKVDISQADGTRVGMSIEEVLRLKNESHMAILKNVGVYIGKDNCIVVKSDHAWINKIFKDTKWSASWLSSLRRLGHAPEKTLKHFAKDLGKQINGALIDLSKV